MIKKILAKYPFVKTRRATVSLIATFAIAVTCLLALGISQSKGLAEMLNGSRSRTSTQTRVNKIGEIKTPSPHPNASPTSTVTTASPKPVVVNGRTYGTPYIAGEVSSTTPSTKPLIVSVSEISTQIAKNSALFTVTSPDSTGICLPSVYLSDGGIAIASPEIQLPACGMHQTVMIIGASKIGTYDLHFFASSPGKINGKYLRYDGYITVHVLPHPAFTLSTSSHLADGNFYVTVTTTLDPGYADSLVAVMYDANSGTPQCSDTTYTPMSDNILMFTCKLGQGIVFNTPNTLKFQGNNGYFTRETTAQFTITSP